MKRLTSLITGTCLLALTFAVAGCGRPSNTALIKQGDYAMWQGRWADAATSYEKAAEEHPGEWEAQYKLGQCYLEMGDPLQACHALSIAESLGQNHAKMPSRPRTFQPIKGKEASFTHAETS